MMCSRLLVVAALGALVGYTHALSAKVVAPGSANVVTVIGASGNVGRLVALRLADEGYGVRAVVRSARARASLKDFLGDRAERIEFVDADVAADDAAAQLKPAIAGAAAAIVCTGTTAFPTKAWAGGGVGADDINGAVLSALFEAKFDLKAAVAALTRRGLNTPERVDGAGLEAVAAAVAGSGARRIVLMSSLGVTRRDGFPFKILDACGVLGAKARGEAAVEAACAAAGASCTIVRPGQLLGGPYTNNVYLGTLFRLDADSEKRGVAIQKGDEAAGDTLRSALAEVLVQALQNPSADGDFTVLTVDGAEPTAATIQASLSEALA